MSTQIIAKVEYPAIFDNSNGCYIWLTPDSKSTMSILNVIKDAPCKTKDGTELHCTIFHSKQDTLPNYESVEFPKDQVWTADGVEIVHWIDHKQRNILVLMLDSDDLDDLHWKICNNGLVHSHDDYNAHISLVKDLEMNEEQLKWLKDTNDKLKWDPIRIAFSPELKGSSC